MISNGEISNLFLTYINNASHMIILFVNKPYDWHCF